jgi:hypothetical protein
MTLQGKIASWMMVTVAGGLSSRRLLNKLSAKRLSARSFLLKIVDWNVTGLKICLRSFMVSAEKVVIQKIGL